MQSKKRERGEYITKMWLKLKAAFESKCKSVPLLTIFFIFILFVFMGCISNKI